MNFICVPKKKICAFIRVSGGSGNTLYQNQVSSQKQMWLEVINSNLTKTLAGNKHKHYIKIKLHPKSNCD
jgi:hypothetical protein